VVGGTGQTSQSAAVASVARRLVSKARRNAGGPGAKRPLYDKYGNDWNPEGGGGGGGGVEDCNFVECVCVCEAGFREWESGGGGVSDSSNESSSSSSSSNGTPTAAAFAALAVSHSSFLRLLTLLSTVYLPSTPGNVLHPMVVFASRVGLCLGNLADFEEGRRLGLRTTVTWGVQNRVTTGVMATVVALQTTFRNCYGDKTPMPSPATSWYAGAGVGGGGGPEGP